MSCCNAEQACDLTVVFVPRLALPGHATPVFASCPSSSESIPVPRLKRFELAGLGVDVKPIDGFELDAVVELVARVAKSHTAKKARCWYPPARNG